MLKHTLAASAAIAAVLALSVPSYALATTAPSAVVTVSGSVTATCSLNGNPSTYAVNMGNLADANGNTLSTSQTVNYLTGAWCNGATSTLSVATTKMMPTTLPGSVPNGFTDSVDYTLKSTSGLLNNQSFDTATGTGGSATVGAFIDNGDSGTITTDAQTAKKLMAGSYAGTITVTLTPGS
ncbi:MAG TPA: hypothetical protein VGG36_00880 [Rhizomicrobium sp.]|jgi:hypothetical protein